MDFIKLKTAVETGDNAQVVLYEVIQELARNHYCPEADGFDGPETYFDCGQCIRCFAKNIIDDGKANEKIKTISDTRCD